MCMMRGRKGVAAGENRSSECSSRGRAVRLALTHPHMGTSWACRIIMRIAQRAVSKYSCVYIRPLAVEQWGPHSFLSSTFLPPRGPVSKAPFLPSAHAASLSLLFLLQQLHS